jgi:hypothetical protein
VEDDGRRCVGGGRGEQTIDGCETLESRLLRLPSVEPRTRRRRGREMCAVSPLLTVARSQKARSVER